MPILVFLGFIFITITLEVAVLISISHVIGFWPTLAWVVLSALIGVRILREQGIKILFNVQEKMKRGEVPALDMMEGMMLTLGSLLLIMPGFISDFFGALCLIPWVRRLFISCLLIKVASKTQQAGSFGASVGQREDRFADSGNIIEGDFSKEDEPSNKL